MFIYDRFEAVRAKKGITKAHIAGAINRTPTIIQDWKKGKSEPNEYQLAIIADVLGTTVAYLCGESDNDALETNKAPSNGGEGGNMTLDDFTVAMHGLSKDLTSTNKLALIQMAEQLAEAERKRRKSGDAD